MIFFNGTPFQKFITVAPPIKFSSMSLQPVLTNTYLNNFRNKLTSNGFTAVNANIYKKGSTMIYFSDIQEGYSSKYIDYYAWKIN